MTTPTASFGTRCIMSAIVGLLTNAALSQEFDIYVSDAGNFDSPPWQILKFDQDGGNPEVFISDNLSWPQDIVFLEDDNTVLISNLNSNRINRHNADTGAFIDTFATSASGPTRMKIGPDNRLYVLQWTGNGRVKRFELDGTPVDDFTSVGVSQSIGLDWDSDGNLYVASFNQASVRRFDPQGNDLGVFISSNLQGPTNVWFDNSGSLLVADWSGGAVRRFNADGSFAGNFITGLSQPEGIDFLPDGNLIIGNGGTGSVRVYDPDGGFVETRVASGAGGLLQPNAVVLRPTGSGSDFVINAGLNDAWLNLETAGQGFLITVFPDLGQVFLAWFTYEVQRPAQDDAQLGESGHRWLTAQGPFEGNTANLTLFVTRGGIFDAGQPTPTTDSDGTLTLAFSDCTQGQVSYRIDSLGLSGEIPIQRIASDNVAMCEALQPE
ncbi:MAG: NHL repeat-containing protein [Xanthomonadales bacterium]|nr:NHL repeat-containing protein [Xanthomonadales bacterium]